MPWLGHVATLIGIISAFITLAVWITIRVDRRVDRAVQATLVPYQHFFKGLTLNQSEEYDLAIPEFRLALEGMLKQGGGRERMVPVLDYYLDSVAYSLRPADYEPDFQGILRHAGTATPILGWHRDRMGWFYLRTSRLDKAEKEFRMSLSLRKGDGDAQNTAWTHWALCLVSLAKGGLDQAVEHALIADEVGGEEYAIEGWATCEADLIRDYGVKGLLEQYPQLKSNLPAFFTRIQNRLQRRAPDADVP